MEPLCFVPNTADGEPILDHYITIAQTGGQLVNLTFDEAENVLIQLAGLLAHADADRLLTILGNITSSVQSGKPPLCVEKNPFQKTAAPSPESEAPSR